MTEIPLYQVDAFSPVPFKGNPAAVCLLPQTYDDATLQAIAAEMNLSETAFLLRGGRRPWTENETFLLRWFTPQVEVRLCGHGTLSAAAVLFNAVEVAAPQVTFQTLSGNLIARRTDDGAIALDFPLDPPLACAPPPDVLEALGVTQAWTAAYGAGAEKLMLHFERAEEVRTLEPDFAALLNAPSMAAYQGLIVTAPGDPATPYDFVSRFFAPAVGINEDPVTGSAHTLLAPYWAERLGKREMFAYQASARGGELRVRLLEGERVEIAGKAVVVFQGQLSL
ncbi:MAG: PhzF family phenazine biosynthesis isomerase [Chloroflexi bacterium]|jgi:PhzF family phenazine biosynthesis protein|nr:PhzF family phenazine biosynthesis isomerase [Chloroflexota bacterium]